MKNITQSVILLTEWAADFYEKHCSYVPFSSYIAVFGLIIPGILVSHETDLGVAMVIPNHLLRIYTTTSIASGLIMLVFHRVSAFGKNMLLAPLFFYIGLTLASWFFRNTPGVPVSLYGLLFVLCVIAIRNEL